MELAWLFGVLFGLVGGLGAKSTVDYNNCLKTQSETVCKIEYGVKK